MQGLFCSKCKSLMPPGSPRCPNCGSSSNDATISNQSCLTGDFSDRRKRARIVTAQESGSPYMPYKPRGCQAEIISDIVNNLEEGRHIVMESGTGTGKTVVSLAACLEHAKLHNKKIIYCTRTISQSDQVMRELRAISKMSDVSGIAVTGRNKSCPLFRGQPGFESLPPNVLSMMCDERKQKSNKGQSGGCRYYDRFKSQIPIVKEYVKSEFPCSDDLDRYCEKLGACPYELKKALMRDCDVIALPYVHILSKDIRNTLMSNLGVEPKDILLIIDEAHNLIDAARNQESFIIDARMIDNAIMECQAFEGCEVYPDVKLRDFITYFRSVIKGVAAEKIGFNMKEVLIEPGFIEEKILSKFGLTRTTLDSALETMTLLGDERTKLLLERGETRESDVQALAIAMRKWFMSDPDKFVRSMKVDQIAGEYLSASCIDPEEISIFLRSVPGAVHMSGTLNPLPQYAQVLGLPKNCRFRTYPSPFPPEHKKVMYVTDVTTAQKEMNRDPSMKDRIEQYISDLCNSVEKNTLVFFTSYANMRSMRPYLERHIRKDMFWEESRNQRKTMENLARFRNGRNGVFFTVMGGSVAEGIDFPGEELCFAIIVGIPFPPPGLESKAMSDLFDRRYGIGKGWLYTSEVPAMRKMKQAIGRLIRTETDKGVAVILDSRASRYAKQLDAAPTADPVGETVRFFG